MRDGINKFRKHAQILIVQLITNLCSFECQNIYPDNFYWRFHADGDY